VVGHLLDVEPAVVVGLDDEDAIDVQRAIDLAGEQVVVDRARRRRVGEPGDDECVVALDRDRTLGEDTLLVRQGGSHDEHVVLRRGRAVRSLSHGRSPSPHPKAGPPRIRAL
jgi:Arc/MetJ family transcription regulator